MNFYLSRKFVIEVLGKRVRYLEDLPRQREQILKEIEQLGSDGQKEKNYLSSQVTMKAADMSLNVTTSKGYRDIMFDTIQAHKKMCEKQLKMLDRELKKNIMTEEIVNYIWFYFLQLEMEERNLIEDLYVEKICWKNILDKYTGSKTTLKAKIVSGLTSIMEKTVAQREEIRIEKN